MSVSLESGPARVVASGQATTFFGAPLRVALDLDGLGQYGIEFHLREEPSGDLRVDSTIEPSRLVLDLVNFRDVVAKGSGAPVLLGEARGTLYFLHFRVWRVGRTPDATLHFTILAASRADVGWVDAAPPEPVR